MNGEIDIERLHQTIEAFNSNNEHLLPRGFGKTRAIIEIVRGHLTVNDQTFQRVLVVGMHHTAVVRLGNDIATALDDWNVWPDMQLHLTSIVSSKGVVELSSLHNSFQSTHANRYDLIVADECYIPPVLISRLTPTGYVVGPVAQQTATTK